jgi:hypothetical protein
MTIVRNARFTELGDEHESVGIVTREIAAGGIADACY